MFKAPSCIEAHVRLCWCPDSQTHTGPRDRCLSGGPGDGQRQREELNGHFEGFIPRIHVAYSGSELLHVQACVVNNDDVSSL